MIGFPAVAAALQCNDEQLMIAGSALCAVA